MAEATDAYDEYDGDEVVYEVELDALEQLGGFALVKLGAGLIATPFEAVNILRQVQYTPSRRYLNLNRPGSPADAPSDDTDQETVFDENSEAGDSDIDPISASALRREAKKAATVSLDDLAASAAATASSADTVGYLVRTGAEGDDTSDPTRPPYEISVLGGASSTQVMGRIVRMRDEGLISLWKGYLTRWTKEVLEAIIQPSIEQGLNDAFDVKDEAIPIVHLENPGPVIATTVLSHALTGILLSPLELVRTRLTVQTSNPYHRKYRGLFDCLGTIIREEGLTSLYWNRRLPATILYHTIRPFFKLTSDFFIQRVLGISPELRPFLHDAATFAATVFELAVLLPLETVRRRLEVQPVRRRTPDISGRVLEPIVRCRQIPYTGMVDCVVRMVIEEGLGAEQDGAKATYGGEGGGRGNHGNNDDESGLDDDDDGDDSDVEGKAKSGKGRRSRARRSRGARGGRKGILGNLGLGPLYRGLRERVLSSLVISTLEHLSTSSTDE